MHINIINKFQVESNTELLFNSNPIKINNYWGKYYLHLSKHDKSQKIYDIIVYFFSFSVIFFIISLTIILLYLTYDMIKYHS